MIQFKNVSFTYTSSSKPSLSDINLSIDDGSYILITGSSGGGKSTLCRCINGLIPYFYGGYLEGSIYVNGIDVTKASVGRLSEIVGMVFQDPENQIIKNNVESEVAFALENKGLPVIEIRRRVEEALDTLGISHLKCRNVDTLSGGEKQKVAIASVLITQPSILILDEPTSELDPRSAEDLLQVIGMLNDDLGLTIILVEHRIDRVLQFVDRVINLEEGRIVFDGEPRSWVSYMMRNNKEKAYIPPVSRLAFVLGQQEYTFHHMPLNIKEARETLIPLFKTRRIHTEKKQNKYKKYDKTPIIKITNCYYRYPTGSIGIKGVNLDVYPGEFVSVIGRNGSGKTTLARLIAGLIKPSRGHVFIKNKDTTKLRPEEIAGLVGIIFQDPNMHLFADTVEEEITFMMNNLGWPENRIRESLEYTIRLFKLEGLKDNYPRMLSTGEKQRVAIASVLSAQPEILILDEPTRGLDPQMKSYLLSYLSEYKRKGGTVILISHDVELIAEYSERVVLMNDGVIISDGSKHDVLSRSLYFSPQVNRLIQPLSSSGWPADLLTVEEVLSLLR
ncbi:MAG: energy-coupling factor transporter ATPase [Candidatus Thermoplasmatota archaeon]